LFGRLSSNQYTFCRHKEVIISEASVAGTDVLKAMEYAKANSVGTGEGSRKCNCGDKCAQYAAWIDQYSKAYGVPDQLLVLSIMMQESSCTQDSTSSAGCRGLMQICDWDICKPIGINSFDDVIGSGNEQNNIKRGIYILKQKYNAVKDEDGSYDPYNCGYKYSDAWDRAVRGYVGWKCGHKNYVEEVKEKYNILKQHAA
ncbi:MAG: lytic transglycosylase domain-containing protein, partial [Candidatus Aenigmarchaeota archaeon]|nr:lytic transglycosylase domain-containing protein [Candidatus Aenigmarchaeota archaeon]